MSEEQAAEIFRRDRPATFKGVIGQDETIHQINALLKRKQLPHTILLSGPTGTGKTTLARIIGSKLKAHDMDINEMNCAGEQRGIEFIRSLAQRIRGKSLHGGVRIWILDECHQLTKDAQDAGLKLFEDVPGHVYFILCSSDPQNLKPTVRTRCTEFKLKELTPSSIEGILTRSIKRNKLTIHPDAIEMIAENSRGSARSALVMLNQIADLPPDNQCKAAASFEERGPAEDLAKLLTKNAPWSSVAAAIKETNADAESLRRGIMAYVTTIMLNQPKPSPFRNRLHRIAQAMQYDFYTTGKSGLVLACYELSTET
jgi:DNA polymerase III gamma/tau subunit